MIKKLWTIGLLLMWTMGVTFGLSCAEFPSFAQMYTDADIAFEWVLLEEVYQPDSSEAQYCSSLWASSLETWLHTFRFSVTDQLKGQVWPTISLDRDVTGVHCTRGGACIDLQVGQEYVVLTDGDTIADGLCSPCPYILASEWDAPACARGYSGQVCGTDGLTYEDHCDLEEVAWVSKAYDGQCVVNTWPPTSLPVWCLSRYDGCNTCSLSDSWDEVCTLMVCVPPLDRAKCTLYDFHILTPAQYNMIGEAISIFVSQNTSTRIQEVIDNATLMIADTQYTLATSTFVIGSPELRRYQFILEILYAIDSFLP